MAEVSAGAGAADARDGEAGVLILYDGACPLCATYVRMLSLRDATGPVRLIDARGGGAEVVAARQAGLDLDQGMLIRLGTASYHGEQAIHVLALLSTGSGIFNGLVARVLRSRRRARLIYPVLTAGRRVLLAVLKRPALR